MHVVEHIVGRSGELRSVDVALEELAHGRGAALEIEGEPGIGKTRLLAEVCRLAEERGHLVLGGSASELENELPFWVFVDALDDCVRALPPAVLKRLDADELARVLPPAGGPPRAISLPDERHRAHHAVRELLTLLAERQPVVLALDDLHWADSGSLELLGALLRRPPSGPVLIALAMRPRQIPERLLPALERAHRAGTLQRVELGVLSLEEARSLLGDAADAVYEESGGNPFYLQQLARVLGRTGHLPRDVTAALAEELALLSDAGRRLLQGAAVAGDPFAPELAAAAGEVEQPLEALDELLRLDLVRSTDVARRFRFRHPLVRRAVYDGAPGGWRLGAHERVAQALAAAGAPASARAHHVERFAQLGDMEAVMVLRDAGLSAGEALPATAAHWFAAALALLPADKDGDRLELLLVHARALAASGDFAGSREALLEGLRLAPPGSPPRARMVAACATTERLLGRPAEGRARVTLELEELADRAVPDAVLLMMELAADGFLQADWARMWEWARKALAVANTIDDAPTLAASTALAAVADAFAGLIADAREHCDAAAAMVDALPDERLTQRIDAGLHLMGAELHLNRFKAGRRHGLRTLELGRTTGQGNLFPILLPGLASCAETLGRLDESVKLLEDGIEAVRVSGNRQALALALMNRSTTASVAGDVETALACGEESLALATEIGNQMPISFAGFALARAYLLAGEPARALAMLLSAGGGEALPRVPGAWQAGFHEMLTLCRLGVGDAAGAAAAAERSAAYARETGLDFARAHAERAAATLNPTRGAERALVAAELFESLEAPLHGAQARVLAARGLDRDDAIAQLERAAAVFDACGASRRREMAEQELRRLGRTVYRRSGAGAGNLEGLTARELEIARLVVDRQTNPQIAAALFLSKKTVETHLRNIFAKVGVSSRVELARAVERADRA